MPRSCAQHHPDSLTHPRPPDTQTRLQVGSPSLPAWRMSGREAADALWALANARHWTPLLPRLEAAVLKSGGLRALRPAQVWMRGLRRVRQTALRRRFRG